MAPRVLLVPFHGKVTGSYPFVQGGLQGDLSGRFLPSGCSPPAHPEGLMLEWILFVPFMLVMLFAVRLWCEWRKPGPP